MDRACIYTKNNIVYKVNDQFIELTGYENNDLLGKSLTDISLLLNSEGQISIQDIDQRQTLYIFGRDSFPVEVTISCENLRDLTNQVYYFEKKVDSTLRCLAYNLDNFDLNPNESMAIFSYPECILLRYNKNYMRTLLLMNVASNDIVGRYPKFSNNISRLFDQDISFHECEVESVGSDKKVTYWDINTKIICGDSGKKYIVSSFYDVTERVRARKLLEKQRREMELILDNISDTINVINTKGEYTYINKLGKKKLSPYIEDVINVDSKTAYSLFTINDINGNQLPFKDIPDQRVLRGEHFTNQLLIGTSYLPTSYYECDGIPMCDEQGNIEGGILIYRNIEDGYKMEEYSAFKENIKDILVCYGSFSYEDFKIKYMNEYAFNRLQRTNLHIKSMLEVIGKNFFDYYEANDKDFIKDLKKAIENNAPYIHKHKFMDGGEVRYEKTLFHATYNQNNEVEKVTAISIDISDEEIANRQMEQVLKAQDKMFINVSHELKTPVNVVFSASQLLESHLENDSIEAMKRDIRYSNKIIMRNCYRLTKLINNILDISKLESGLYELTLSNCNVVDIIDDIVELVSEHVKVKGLEIIFDTQVEDLVIALDIDNFEKALLNLISNAIKFSNPNGMIKINLVEKYNAIEISVQDDGIGIAQENLSLIFKKFKQLNTSLNRETEGTGIGLSLVKSIVELHGGCIDVQSTLGLGSTFIMEFPIIALDNIMSDKSCNRDGSYNKNKTEMVRFELSDIYA